MKAGDPSSILFVTRKWPPAVGGMETYSVELVRELRLMGKTVEVISLAGQPDGDPPGAFAILRFGLGTALRLILRRGKWGVVHGGDLAIWPLVWLASLSARSRPKPVLSAHGTDVSFAFGAGFLRRIYRAYLAAARALLSPDLVVVSNSDATSDKLRLLGFNRVEKVVLGCRASLDAPVTEKPQRLLFAGRLVARKGLSWFTREVLPFLPERVTLVVAGKEWDASETRALSHPRVAFLGPLKQQDLWAEMAGALAVVIPNRATGNHQFEGFGLIAAEAAAVGGIVLASDIDGYRDSVITNKTGKLLPTEDPDAWVAEITELAQKTPAARCEIRREAQSVALQRFSWDRVARETADAYRA